MQKVHVLADLMQVLLALAAELEIHDYRTAVGFYHDAVRTAGLQYSSVTIYDGCLVEKGIIAAEPVMYTRFLYMIGNLMLKALCLGTGFQQTVAEHLVNGWVYIGLSADGGKEVVQQLAGLDVLLLPVIGIIGGMDKTGGFARLAEACVYGIGVHPEFLGCGLKFKRVV